MFITEEDYRAIVGEQTLKVISRTSVENRVNAELEVQEEILGYLRPGYGCGAVFSAGGDGRNRLVVMCTYDIALYHMSASQPQKMDAGIYEERYKRTIEWLEGVQAERIIPDLPLAVDEDGKPTGRMFTCSS